MKMEMLYKDDNTLKLKYQELISLFWLLVFLTGCMIRAGVSREDPADTSEPSQRKAHVRACIPGDNVMHSHSREKTAGCERGFGGSM